MKKINKVIVEIIMFCAIVGLIIDPAPFIVTVSAIGGEEVIVGSSFMYEYKDLSAPNRTFEINDTSKAEIGRVSESSMKLPGTGYTGYTYKMYISVRSLGSFSLKRYNNIGKVEYSKNYSAVLNYKEDLMSADNLVKKAETSHLSSDLDSAHRLVMKLNESEEKTSFLSRLDIVQFTIQKEVINHATEEVKKAEDTKTDATRKAAQALVNALPEVTEKTTLQTRLDAIVTVEDVLLRAAISVEQAEASKKQTDVDSARKLVDGLVKSTDKAKLLDRLNVVQAGINQAAAEAQALVTAVKAVEKAEDNKKQTEVDSARKLVDGLVKSTDKAKLLDRLNVVQAGINQAAAEAQALVTAVKAVEKAEDNKKQTEVDSARKLVDGLVKSTDKAKLLDRLNVVQAGINQAAAEAQALVTAVKAVEKAEDNKNKRRSTVQEN